MSPILPGTDCKAAQLKCPKNMDLEHPLSESLRLPTGQIQRSTISSCISITSYHPDNTFSEWFCAGGLALPLMEEPAKAISYFLNKLWHLARSNCSCAALVVV